MGHQISRHLDSPIFTHFKIWYPILICLYLGSRILYIEVFVLQTKLCIPPFQSIMFQLSSMFIAGEVKEMPSVKFFLKHPVWWLQTLLGKGLAWWHLPQLLRIVTEEEKKPLKETILKSRKEALGASFSYFPPWSTWGHTCFFPHPIHISGWFFLHTEVELHCKLAEEWDISTDSTSLGFTDTQMKTCFAPLAQYFTPFLRKMSKFCHFPLAQNVAFMVLKTTGTISRFQRKNLHWSIQLPTQPIDWKSNKKLWPIWCR